MSTYTIQEVMKLVISVPFQKFKHPYFSPDEYIYGDGQGHLCDEKGYHLPWDEFWGLRMSGGIKEGWYVIDE